MYCGVCGVPVGITRGNIWHAGGSINGRFPPHIKGTFFDVEELGFLFRSLSEMMDYDIGSIVARGKYHDAREYMGALLGFLGNSRGELPPEEELYNMMLYPIRIWGVAMVDFEKVDGEEKVIRVKEPYSIPLLCGDVAGVADAVTGREHMATWEGGEHEGVIRAFPSRGFAAVNGLIEEADDYAGKHVSGELEGELCGECGAPQGVGGLFAWDTEGCRIEDRNSKRRYCFNNTRGITAVLRMLVAELGEDVEESMVDISHQYSRSLHRCDGGGAEAGGARPHSDPRECLGNFPYRGWGRVTQADQQGKTWTVSVKDPYNGVLLAGRICGIIEASLGQELRVASINEEADTLRLVFEPR